MNETLQLPWPVNFFNEVFGIKPEAYCNLIEKDPILIDNNIDETIYLIAKHGVEKCIKVRFEKLHSNKENSNREKRIPTVLVRRFKERKTLKEIAEEFGVCSQTIRCDIGRGLRVMRHPGVLKVIKTSLGDTNYFTINEHLSLYPKEHSNWLVVLLIKRFDQWEKEWRWIKDTLFEVYSSECITESLILKFIENFCKEQKVKSSELTFVYLKYYSDLLYKLKHPEARENFEGDAKLIQTFEGELFDFLERKVKQAYFNEISSEDWINHTSLSILKDFPQDEKILRLVINEFFAEPISYPMFLKFKLIDFPKDFFRKKYEKFIKKRFIQKNFIANAFELKEFVFRKHYFYDVPEEFCKSLHEEMLSQYKRLQKLRWKGAGVITHGI